MNAEPFIEKVVAAMKEARLEGILIGNAAAAIQGAPVTTDDFDFFIRDKPPWMDKIAEISEALGAGKFLIPYPEVSDLIRISAPNIQVDFMFYIGPRLTFESVRSRSTVVQMKAGKLMVASLADVIKSKKNANRLKDKAVLPLLEEVLRASKK